MKVSEIEKTSQTLLQFNMLSDTDVDDHYNPSTRSVNIERKTLESWGFHLTRSKWDPYPWISSVDEESAASLAGLKSGDCLLEVNGEDIVGQRISEIAETVKSDKISLLLWNAGIDPQYCSQQTLCCGPMPGNLQRLSASMSAILEFLECPICLDTISPPTYQCENGHLICIRCRAKSERCPICRLRFTRGRSLIADHVYNVLIDAFNLKEEPNDARNTKMQQIFKLKSKNKNIPDIKIAHTHKNKFLAKLNGKSNSVDNLDNSKYLNFLNVSNEFNGSLKTKSLSTNEIFHNESPIVSRAGSVTKLSRNEKAKSLRASPDRPASYHGSLESLQRNTEPFQNFQDNNLYHCPFVTNCTSLIKAKNLIDHFQAIHDEIYLVQIFRSNIGIKVKKIKKLKTMCYIIPYNNNIFFLKVQICNFNLLLWTWILGNKEIAKNYRMQVKIYDNYEQQEIFCVENCVYSLSSVSHQDVENFKNGVFISAKTIEHQNAILDLKII